MPRRRIFVAIAIPEEIKRKNLVWQKNHDRIPVRPVRSQTPSASADAQVHQTSNGIRWIKSENLHITVVPPWYARCHNFDYKDVASADAGQSCGTGYVTDECCETIRVLHGALESIKPFSVRFEKILFGPPGQPPRLIWAEGETPPELILLKEELQNVLLLNPAAGFPKKETRPAKLHLTIARFRPGSIKKLPLLDGGVDWKFEVSSVDLMESKLKRTGAEYTTLQKFSFIRNL